MNLIIDIQYFPSINLYKNLYKFSNIVFDQYEAYEKMSFRNRCQVAGADGIVDLSIPLLKGRGQKTIVKDVRISDRQPWAAQHWKTIVSCYSRSPWFDHYRDEMEGFYRRRFDFLLDWDLACFEWSIRVLGIQIGVGLTEKWVDQNVPGEMSDWRGKMKPKDREVGLGGEVEKPGGRKDAGGRLVSPSQPVQYRQVFEERTGFIPNLSILDLLFCEGKNAAGYLGRRGARGND